MPDASDQYRYTQAYVILRIERGASIDIPPMTFERDGMTIPGAGPNGVTVKEVVMTAEEAQAEVIRLNQLNADMGFAYYWQTTHLFINGGSHGSQAARTE